MNLAQIRAAVCGNLRWEPKTPEEVLKHLDTPINMAMREFYAAHPRGCTPTTERAVLWRERTEADLHGALISTTTDPYVLQWDEVAAEAPPLLGGVWAGLTLDVQDLTADAAKDQWHSYMIRDVWVTNSILLTIQRYRVAVDRPVHKTLTSVRWRIRQTAVYLPEDIDHVEAAYDYRQAATREIRVVEGNDQYVRQARRADVGGVTPLLALYRDNHFQVDASTYTPIVTSNEAAWVGKEPPGTFEYLYTVGFGKYPTELLNPGGLSRPMCESGPSPVSAKIVVPPNGSSSVRVGLPNLAWMYNFDPSPAELRNGHSGLFKCVYRRRVTVTGSSGSFTTAIEAPNVWQLIALVPDTTLHWDDYGSIIPDRQRRLPEVSGYYGLRPMHGCDVDTPVEFVVTRPPRTLVTANDVPPILNRLMPLFIELATFHTGRKSSPEAALAALERWEQGAGTVTRILQPSVEAVDAPRYNPGEVHEEPLADLTLQPQKTWKIVQL